MSKMMLKLKRGAGDIAFMNKDIFYAEGKAVTLDRALTNLFMKICNGNKKYVPSYTKEYKIDYIKFIVDTLEKEGKIIGASENPEAVEDWLRSSILEIVNRGNVVKEHIATLKPLHLLSFRIKNAKYSKDYKASEQLFLMLHSAPEVEQALKTYLEKGYDTETGNIVVQETLDVDTTGLINIANTQKQRKEYDKEVEETPEPFLKQQASLFTDDIRRLLLYKDKLPRTVFIDYLKILCGFHLCLYIMKLIYLLPRMIEEGTREVEDDWNMVVDLSGNLESEISGIACKDMEKIENSIGKYVQSVYLIDLVQNRPKMKGASIDDVLYYIKNENDPGGEYWEMVLDNIRKNLDSKSENEINQDDLDYYLRYFEPDDYISKVIYVLEKSNLGSYQAKYLRDFIDKVSMKNTPSMFLADSRSRKHPRRGVIGSKLLETLVQLLVLREKENGHYETRSLSIEELADLILERYGLVINGLSEPRFSDGDVSVNNAFRRNMEALKDRLRQIGFYTDLSDATILQKIRPRYNLDN